MYTLPIKIESKSIMLIVTIFSTHFDLFFPLWQTCLLIPLLLCYLILYRYNTAKM